MKRRMVSMMMVLLMMAAVLSGCGSSQQIRFGAAGEGGTYYVYGMSAAETVRSAKGYEFDVKATAGSAANIRLLSEGYLQMAIAQSDVAADAWNGVGAFREDARTGYSAVASLYTEFCQIIVRGNSEISCVEDLYGKVVSVGEKESGTELNAQQILECCGLGGTAVQLRNDGYRQAAQALKNGEIDAFFCTAGLSMETIRDLADEVPLRLLSLNERQVERLMDTYGGYVRCTVPARTYAGQTEEIQTVGVRAVLLASDELKDEVVKNVLTVLMDNGEKLKTAAGLEMALSLETCGEGVAIPYHPGAAAFYREHGVEMEAAK